MKFRRAEHEAHIRGIYFYASAEKRGESADLRALRALADGRVPSARKVLFPAVCLPVGAHRCAIIERASENPGHPFSSACRPRHKYRPLYIRTRGR